MKKILLAVTAALAITSCSQNEEFDNVGQKAEINFGSIVGNSTRASITTKNNFTEFTVNGFRTTKVMSENPQLETGFMDGVLVTRKTEGENISWGMNTPYYWPASGYVQFFAASSKLNLNLSNTGYPTFDYTVGSIDQQKDLLVAKLIDNEKTSSSVILPFKHALTQVNFSVKGNTKGFTYKISELVIEGVNDKGTFAFDATDNAGSWTSVSKSSPTTAYTYKPSTPIEFTTSDSNAEEPLTSLEKSDESLFMLLPQEMTADMILSITYIAIPKDKTEEIDQTFKGTKKVALTGKWESGKKIRYTLTLTSDATSIDMGDPAIDDWKEGSNNPLSPSSSN